MITKEQVLLLINQKEACDSGIDWFIDQEGTVEEIYNDCEDLDWINWLLYGALNQPDPLYTEYLRGLEELGEDEDDELWKTYLVNSLLPWPDVEVALEKAIGEMDNG